MPKTIKKLENYILPDSYFEAAEKFKGYEMLNMIKVVYGVIEALNLLIDSHNASLTKEVEDFYRDPKTIEKGCVGELADDGIRFYSTNPKEEVKNRLTDMTPEEALSSPGVIIVPKATEGVSGKESDLRNFGGTVSGSGTSTQCKHQLSFGVCLKCGYHQDLPPLETEPKQDDLVYKSQIIKALEKLKVRGDVEYGAGFNYALFYAINLIKKL